MIRGGLHGRQGRHWSNNCNACPWWWRGTVKITDRVIYLDKTLMFKYLPYEIMNVRKTLFSKNHVFIISKRNLSNPIKPFCWYIQALGSISQTAYKAIIQIMSEYMELWRKKYPPIRYKSHTTWHLGCRNMCKIARLWPNWTNRLRLEQK